jgi:hypothetical protein
MKHLMDLNRRQLLAGLAATTGFGSSLAYAQSKEYEVRV